MVLNGPLSYSYAAGQWTFTLQAQNTGSQTYNNVEFVPEFLWDTATSPYPALSWNNIAQDWTGNGDNSPSPATTPARAPRRRSICPSARRTLRHPLAAIPWRPWPRLPRPIPPRPFRWGILDRGRRRISPSFAPPTTSTPPSPASSSSRSRGRCGRQTISPTPKRHLRNLGRRSVHLRQRAHGHLDRAASGPPAGGTPVIVSGLNFSGANTVYFALMALLSVRA